MDFLYEAPWAVHASVLPLLRRAAAGEKGVDFGGPDKHALEVTAVRSDSGNSGTEADAGNVVVIPISGTLVKRSGWYIDMQDYSRFVREAAADPSVMGIIILMDTPGGQVNGTMELARTVAEAGKKKPVAAVVDGLCASAGYWVASASQRIFCANDTVEIGSIGVMTSFMDFRPALEKDGVKFHEVYSSLSPDKNRMENDLLKGKYDEYREKVLDPLAKLFIQYVQAHRPEVKDEALTGSVYFPAEAIKMGLADQMGGVEEAVAWIAAQTEEGADSADAEGSEASAASGLNTDATLKTIAMKNMENIVAVLGELEMKDGGVFLNQEQLEALNAALGKTPDGQGNGVAEAVSAAMAPLMERMVSMEEAARKMEERLATLEKQPAGQGGGASRDSDFKGNSANEWAYADNI